MANFDIKENVDDKVATTAIAGSGVNIIPKTGDIIPYAGTVGTIGATGTSDAFTMGTATNYNTGSYPFFYVGQGIYHPTYLPTSATITAVSPNLTFDKPLIGSPPSYTTFYLSPAGWVVCDGSNGTPDLRGDFVVGATAAGNIGTSGGTGTHTHAYSFGSPAYGNSSFSHTAYSGAGCSENNSHSDHSHGKGSNVTGNSFAGSNFIQATNATGTSKCLRSGHTHNENFNWNTGNITAYPNHNHVVNSSRSDSESHTHTVATASASGSASATSINLPYITMNYIMKL